MNVNIWSVPWFTIPVLLFFNVGLALLLFVPYGAEILYLNPWRTEPLNTFFRGATELGEAVAFVALGLISLLWRFRFALLIALTGLLVMPVSYLLKDKIGTDRPVTYFEKNGVRDAVVLVPGVKPNGGKTSFPSGHTMAAFSLYTLLALLTRRKWPWLGLALAWTAMLVAISRVFLVQHFLADILGGAFFGMALAWLVFSLDRRFFARMTVLDRGLLSASRTS
ncbi:MAG: phosphatase PAP2 family protein [Bacteroidetes bacterium]|nr:MAG: phosphatase PAP2 family protein [Bacteroidota bacterium]